MLVIFSKFEIPLTDVEVKPPPSCISEVVILGPSLSPPGEVVGDGKVLRILSDGDENG